MLRKNAVILARKFRQDRDGVTASLEGILLACSHDFRGSLEGNHEGTPYQFQRLATFVPNCTCRDCTFGTGLGDASSLVHIGL